MANENHSVFMSRRCCILY